MIRNGRSTVGAEGLLQEYEQYEEKGHNITVCTNSQTFPATRVEGCIVTRHLFAKVPGPSMTALEDKTCIHSSEVPGSRRCR